jgi:hypothetical protein
VYPITQIYFTFPFSLCITYLSNINYNMLPYLFNHFIHVTNLCAGEKHLTIRIQYLNTVVFFSFTISNQNIVSQNWIDCLPGIHLQVSTTKFIDTSSTTSISSLTPFPMILLYFNIFCWSFEQGRISFHVFEVNLHFFSCDLN